ncbi:MAG: glycine cleavage system aminomethyltransferase GcvT [Acidimicrobiales bacterium]
MLDSGPLRTTPLHDLHRARGGKLVDFAGWDLPLSFEGVIAEHTWCRTHAALFDVSHMATVELRSLADEPDPVQRVAAALETLTPAAVTSLQPGRQRYAVLTTADGGILDDLIITNRGTFLQLVLNAGRREVDLAHLRKHLPAEIEVVERLDVALLALQGPEAAAVMARLNPAVADLVFLDHAELALTLGDGPGHDPVTVGVSRSGYTGEDGFELAVPAERAVAVAERLLGQAEVAPAGLGARDTLRLEAGLPLYGHDLDETTSPVEAGLTWTIPKRRRLEGGFPGVERIIRELADGPARIRVGLRAEGRRPVRDDAPVVDEAGRAVGLVTSGGYGPTVGGPVAMGYLSPELADPGRSLAAPIRSARVPIEVTALPFVPHRYHRGTPS